MKVIGHRGAAGLAAENTVASIAAAIAAGVDAIEFDLRLTRDQKIVVNHDASLQRTYGKDLIISEHDLSELKTACPTLPTFEDIIKACGSHPMVIELKDVIPAEILYNVLKEVSIDQYSFVSFKLAALQAVKPVFPNVPLSLLSFAWPCWREHQAHQSGLQGIGVYWLFLNPLVYWQTKRHDLEIYTYTINNPLMARIVSSLYPRVNICTDRPDRMQTLRSK